MTEREFCCWLQGLLEATGNKTLNRDEVAAVKYRLGQVFSTATPSRTVTPAQPQMFSQPRTKKGPTNDDKET